MDPAKVGSAVESPILHNVKGVRGVLEFTSYCSVGTSFKGMDLLIVGEIKSY